MANFIFGMIKQEADKSLELGIAKYNAYFINTTLYQSQRAEVDQKLTDSGYEDVIQP